MPRGPSKQKRAVGRKAAASSAQVHDRPESIESAARKLKVRKIGNSLGLILPKEVAAKLQAKEGDTYYATESPEGRVYITPYDPDFDSAMEKARDIMRRYANTLRELAK